MMRRRHAVSADERHLAVFEVDGESLTMQNCTPFAQVANEAAGIIDAVLVAPSGRYVRVTTVVDAVGDEEPGADHRGWYVAAVVDAFAANLLRESWAVQVQQPSAEIAHPLV